MVAYPTSKELTHRIHKEMENTNTHGQQNPLAIARIKVK